VTPFTQLTKKYQPFYWGVEADNAFQSLKVSFTTNPLLIHVDLFKPFILATDVSNFAIGVMLSQLGKDNLFNPINFRSHKFSPTKINYKIHDKELLAIVEVFEE
jgi:hypothetical protein